MWLFVAVTALLVVAWWLFNWMKSGAYLLSSRYIADSPPPVETDYKKRDKVLKQGYSPEKIPKNLDVIVIGSGIGGLSAAVFLARAGKKVLVLERNHRAGGMCSAFGAETGFEYDIGLHYVGFLHDENNPFAILFKRLTKGKVVFDEIPGTCDHVVIGTVKDRRYEAFGGPFFSGLLRQFPGEKTAILKLQKMAQEAMDQVLVIGVFKVLPIWLAKLVVKSGILKYTVFKYQDQPLMKVINDVGIQDQKLRATLEYITAVAGLDATSCSYMLYSFLLWSYNASSHYPRGGANEIPLHLIPQVEEAGGRVLVSANVKEILFSNDGRVEGVKVAPTNSLDATDDCHVYAPVVVSDAGIMNTFQRGLVPQPIAWKSRYYKYCEDVGPSDSYFQVMVGLNGTTEELGLEPNNLWYVRETDTLEHPELVRNMAIGKWKTEGITWLCVNSHSAKDSAWNDRFPGKSGVQLLFSCDYEGLKKYEGKNGERLDVEEYNTVKQNIGKIAWDKFCEYYPKCKDRVEQFQVGTSLTYNHYLNTVKGEVYGLDHSIARSHPVAIAEMRSKTDIPGLYLTGQDSVFFGIPTNAWAGFACACEILGHKALAPSLFLMEKSALIRNWLLGY